MLCESLPERLFFRPGRGAQERVRLTLGSAGPSRRNNWSPPASAMRFASSSHRPVTRRAGRRRRRNRDRRFDGDRRPGLPSLMTRQESSPDVIGGLDQGAGPCHWRVGLSRFGWLGQREFTPAREFLHAHALRFSQKVPLRRQISRCPNQSVSISRSSSFFHPKSVGLSSLCHPK